MGHALALPLSKSVPNKSKLYWVTETQDPLAVLILDIVVRTEPHNLPQIPALDGTQLGVVEKCKYTFDVNFGPDNIILLFTSLKQPSAKLHAEVSDISL